MSVFVDTTAFYALIDADDGNHRRALAVWRELAGERAKLVTHNLVLTESIALVQARMGLRAVRDLLVLFALAETIWIGADDHEEALRALFSSNRRRVSFVDHASFHVMRRQGVRRAMAFDPHFAQEGFVLAGDRPVSGSE